MWKVGGLDFVPIITCSLFLSQKIVGWFLEEDGYKTTCKHSESSLIHLQIILG